MTAVDDEVARVAHSADLEHARPPLLPRSIHPSEHGCLGPWCTGCRVLGRANWPEEATDRAGIRKTSDLVPRTTKLAFRFHELALQANLYAILFVCVAHDARKLLGLKARRRTCSLSPSRSVDRAVDDVMNIVHTHEMTKRLQAIGNSAGIIIDRPILDLLGITQETELDLKTDGRRLIITPLENDQSRRGRLAKVQARALRRHAETFRKLAK
jgi:antitoxin MazE